MDLAIEILCSSMNLSDKYNFVKTHTLYGIYTGSVIQYIALNYKATNLRRTINILRLLKR
ncbi:hypothetical protein MASR2M29_20600 [Spirochaetota bacterium]